jgi:hypothetical protein
MSFGFRHENGEHIPCTICDHCGLPIEDTREAIAKYWTPRNAPLEPGQKSVLMVHKMDCDFNSPGWAAGGDRKWSWMQLDIFMNHLLRNMQGSNSGTR